MPIIAIPIVWAIVAGVVIVSAITLAKWSDVEKFFFGKSIAILGAKATGKTHLLNFLLKGTIPVEYEQTLEPVAFKGRLFELDNLKLRLKKSNDVSGIKMFRNTWKQPTENADIIIYLVRTDKVLNENDRYIKRVIDDIKYIRGFNFKNEAELYIIGTFLDLCPDYSENKKFIGTSTEKFINHKIVKGLQGLQKENTGTIIIGSMKNIENTRVLVKRLFDHYVKIKK